MIYKLYKIGNLCVLIGVIDNDYNLKVIYFIGGWVNILKILNYMIIKVLIFCYDRDFIF